MSSTINQLSAITSLSYGDLLPVYSSNNGDSRKCSLSTLQTFIFDINSLSTVATVIDDLDYFSVYDASAGVTVKTTATSVREYARNNLYTGMTAGAGIVDADLFNIYDSSESAIRSVTGTQLINYLNGALQSDFITQKASPSATAFPSHDPDQLKEA